MTSGRARLANAFLRRKIKPAWAPDLKVEDARRVAARADGWLAGPRAGKPGRAVVMNDVRAEWFDPARCAAERVVLYLHGGAFVMHLPRFYRSFARRFANLCRASILLPDYRLAPEHRFPAAVDDCLAAYANLIETGIDARMIAVGGDSAGGNLALVTLTRIRDEGLPQPACGFMISPPTDFTLSLPSVRTNEAEDPMLSTRGADFVIGAYLASRELVAHGRVSPLFADLRGLPPLLLHAGSTEILVDGVTQLAERARDAGVEATAKVWPDMPHCFQLVSFLPEGVRALDEIARFVRANTRGTASAA